MDATLNRIGAKVKRIEEELKSFQGSKLDDAYYDLDQNITDYMCQLDNMKVNVALKEKKKTLLRKLNSLSDIYEEKCKKAPSTLSTDEIALKTSQLQNIARNLNTIDAQIQLFAGEESQHKIIDGKLLDLFKQANNVETNRHDGVVAEKQRVIRSIQKRMLRLSEAVESHKPELTLVEITEQLSRAVTLEELEDLFKRISKFKISRGNEAAKIKEMIRKRIQEAKGEVAGTSASNKRRLDDDNDVEMTYKKPRMHEGFEQLLAIKDQILSVILSSIIRIDEVLDSGVNALKQKLLGILNKCHDLLIKIE